jgi:TldD protein
MTQQQLKQRFDFAPGFDKYVLNGSGKTAKEIAEQNQVCTYLADPIDSLANEKQICNTVLGLLKEQKIDYGDLRLGRDLDRTLSLSDENIVHHAFNQNEGIGIRVLANGFWGFSSTDDLSPDSLRRCTMRAIAMAKGVAAVTPKQLRLSLDHFANEPVHQAEFHTPVLICPFSADMGFLAEPFRSGAEIAAKIPGIKRVYSKLFTYGRRRIFANTEGSYILTTHVVCDPIQMFVAVDNGSSAYRNVLGTALAGGFEHTIAADFPAQAEGAAREAVLKCGAKTPAPGDYTLILDGHNLALTMHESVGHPTELDRVLGYELGFAGGSFASIDKLHRFQYGSPIVNFTANNRILFGGASVGYDDEGVACSSFPIIREGFLVGYGTNRETAKSIGQDRANGTCRSTRWSDTPIVRIPNLFLEPGKNRLSKDELIADTKDGILMLGRDSFSIDQMRYNFQFGADMCYRIKNGKITEPLKDVIYQSISPEFWNSCDAICDESEWQMHGVFNCGKGQPTQTAKMMHGAAPSRFRNIKVGF